MQPEWKYWCPENHPWRIVEISEGRGRSLRGLALHMEAEDQIIHVLKGQRRFRFANGQEIRVGAGETVRLPAGMPHASLSETSGEETVCLNLYAPSDTLHAHADLVELLRHEFGGSSFKILPTPQAPLAPLSEKLTHLLLTRSVQEVAQQQGIARETFSHNFNHLYGVSPCVMRLLLQVGRARELLRHQYSLAETSLAAGFYDQSHMTRHFKLQLGTTPGLFSQG